MRLILIFILFVINSLPVSAQKNYRYSYFLDKNFTAVKEKDASYVGKAFIDNDLLQLDCFDANNYLFLSVHFTDSTLSNMTGKFMSFFPTGKVKTSGLYDTGLEEDVWIKYDSTGLPIDSTAYTSGKAISTKEYSYHKNGRISEFDFTDSIKKTEHIEIYDSIGKKIREIEIAGTSGIKRGYDAKGNYTETPLISVERKEAEFKGGMEAYQKWLRTSLNMNAVNSKATAGIYTVIIKFIVNKNGTVTDVIPETNIGYGMEEEGLRVIKNSPRWIPASMFGESIKAYRRQPVTFIISEN